MKALISGSLAYDIIMVYDDKFDNHILPDKVHMLNVCFVVPELRRDFGGCAGNIAYNLNLLGAEVLPFGTVGEDFASYRDWLDKNQINRDFVKEVPGSYTAQAFITSDLKDNQITAFHPGAMDYSPQLSIPSDRGITIGTISPDPPEGMKRHADEFVEQGIPFIFDPGQAITRFDGDTLLELIDQATWVAANDYEAQLIQDRTGLSESQIAERVDAMIVTLGGEGSYIIKNNGEKIEIPAAPVSQVVDPTGCGDAYRAGLLYGLMNGMDWQTSGRVASLAGAIKIEHAGTQNHRYDIAEFNTRFEQAFGYRL